MKCPYRVCEVHDVHNTSVTSVHLEYENCYGRECPYWGKLNYSAYEDGVGCRKAEKEVK